MYLSWWRGGAGWCRLCESPPLSSGGGVREDAGSVENTFSGREAGTCITEII